MKKPHKVLLGFVCLAAVSAVSLVSWKSHRQQVAITHYSEMTNAYQRDRVYVGSFAGELHQSYLDHRAAAERLGTVQRRIYGLSPSFTSVNTAREFALAFEAQFPHVPEEMDGCYPAETPTIVVWARPNEFGAIDSFITNHSKR